MNIPQVNATATDRNREQTERICELVGGGYLPQDGLHNEAVACALPGSRSGVALPNGSFTLCQVAGMLGFEGVGWRQPLPQGLPRGWWDVDLVLEAKGPHDLTAAMDALIKVLEEKARPTLEGTVR